VQKTIRVPYAVAISRSTRHDFRVWPSMAPIFTIFNRKPHSSCLSSFMFILFHEIFLEPFQDSPMQTENVLLYTSYLVIPFRFSIYANVFVLTFLGIGVTKIAIVFYYLMHMAQNHKKCSRDTIKYSKFGQKLNYFLI